MSRLLQKFTSCKAGKRDLAWRFDQASLVMRASEVAVWTANWRGMANKGVFLLHFVSVCCPLWSTIHWATSVSNPIIFSIATSDRKEDWGNGIPPPPLAPLEEDKKAATAAMQAGTQKGPHLICFNQDGRRGKQQQGNWRQGRKGRLQLLCSAMPVLPFTSLPTQLLF